MAGPDGVTAAALERAYRDEWTAVVATISRRLCDLQAAEDAAAEAFAAAAAGPPAAAPQDATMVDDRLVDDRLGLIFACCHPALAPEVRVAGRGRGWPSWSPCSLPVS